MLDLGSHEVNCSTAEWRAEFRVLFYRFIKQNTVSIAVKYFPKSGRRWSENMCLWAIGFARFMRDSSITYEACRRKVIGRAQSFRDVRGNWVPECGGRLELISILF